MIHFDMKQMIFMESYIMHSVYDIEIYDHNKYFLVTADSYIMLNTVGVCIHQILYIFSG